MNLQVKMLLKEIEQGIMKEVSLDEWERLWKNCFAPGQTINLCGLPLIHYPSPKDPVNGSFCFEF
jgi:hypothetical protein